MDYGAASCQSEKDENGWSAADKIATIFRFRIPYFVGPLNQKSGRAWLTRKEGRITPWNFAQMVDLDASENAFIRNMTGHCTYLPGEPVVPANALCYAKFTVLNELNTLKINSVPITVAQKQAIYNDVFCKYKKPTVKALRNYCISEGFMAKNLELLPDIIPFSGNRKNLLNKVLTAVEKNGMENIEEVQKLSAEIETYLLSISEDWPLSFDMGKITPASLLKLAGAQIELGGESLLEDLLTYMDLTAEMEREKIFCLLNLHCYFSIEELDTFFHSVALRQHRLLIFEGSEYPCVHEEKKIVIDKDLCQIIL